ncbi:MAG TPA: endonuclease/exonuclease/phosphatase family protein [Gallionellaceae bacterium]
MPTFKIATYNIHKGLSPFNRRAILHDLRERLHELDADIVFLQEVQGERLFGRHAVDTGKPQHEFLGQENWPHQAYGMNAVYDGGHHGNAIVSRFPILSWDNQDVSTNPLESRGMLHCEIALPGGDKLHCLCVHFDLTKRGRSIQFNALTERVKKVVPPDAPLLIAGDFNDWNNHASHLLERELEVREAFEARGGKLAKSWPARLPIFRLDRIYVRGLDIVHCEMHPWRKISDHAALSAMLALP